MIRIIPFFTFVLLPFFLAGQSPCLIDSVTIWTGDCQDGKADIWLDLQVPSGLDQGTFEVRGNGKEYGTYSYADLPVNLGPVQIIPTLNYEFVVQDLSLDSCSAAVEYGMISCATDSGCQIGPLSATVLDSCGGAGYRVLLDFESAGISHADIYVDGEFLQYIAIADLPVKLEIPHNHTGETVLKVFANDLHDCYGKLSIQLPRCSDECGISNLVAKALECSDSSFYVKLDLDHYGPHSAFFQVYIGDGEIGSYPYSALPVLIGPFLAGESDVLAIRVRDSLYQDCVLETSIDGSPCDDFCFLGMPNAVISQCDSGLFSVSIDFEHSGALSDSFKLRGNGHLYGLFAYADLPVQLEGLKADGSTPYEFVVIDQEGGCRNFMELGTVDCFCLWSEIVIDPGDCTSDSTYSLVINFEPGNVDSFTLTTEGQQLGTFSAEALPLTVSDFPASGARLDELWVCAAMTNCCLRFEVESPLCVRTSCQITEVQATPLECQEGQHKLLLDFNHEGVSGEHFVLRKNGEWLGRYAYRNLPVKIGPFWNQDSAVYVLEIVDAVNEDCVTEVEISDPGCHGCPIVEIKTEVGTCTSDSTYLVTLHADLTGAFDFYANGHFCGTFESAQLPLTFDDFPASGEPYDYIKICSLDSNYCCREMKIESPVCARNRCPFEGVRFELTECDSNNQFYAWIILDTIGSAEGTFVVQRENTLLEFSYESLPVKIGPLEGGETFYKYRIYDAINTDCKKDLVIGRVICSSQCNLDFAEVSIAGCDEEEVVLLIDSMEGPYSAFDVSFGDQYLGNHKKEELPLRLKARVPENGEEVKVRICVSDNNTCCFEKVLSLTGCINQVECALDKIWFDTIECRNDSFYVNLNTSEQGIDSGAYLLKINGEGYREFSGADFPLLVGPLAAGADRKYDLLIRSLLNENCAAELTLDGVGCPANGLAENLRLLVVESSNYTNYIKVPDFISDRSKFQLFDLSGRLLYEMDFSAETRRAFIQVPLPVAGMYLVKIRSNDGQQHLSKIVIP